MEQPETDTEIFDRIPWETLKTGSDRRWMAYAAAAVVVVGAIGLSLGRSVGGQSPPTTPVVAAVTLATTAMPATTRTQMTTAPPSTSPEAITEADLMAIDPAAFEVAAMTTAEWFVVDWFTRDGSEGDGSRSFVEWAAPLQFHRTGEADGSVVVFVRRLAAVAGDEYQRVPDEAWSVAVTLTATGWEVVDGPHATEMDLQAGASQVDADLEWIDAAGLVWTISEGATGE